MAQKSKIAAIIVAGGTGTRLGGRLPKQFQMLAGQTLLRRSVEAFTCHPVVDVVQVVICGGFEMEYGKAMDGLNLPKPVIGGDTRQASVKKGLEALAGEAPDVVLIHDAARPMVSAAVIQRVLGALEADAQAVIPGVKVVDTLKKVNAEGVVQTTASRDGMVQVQTPQGFGYRMLVDLHQQAGDGHSDDAMLCEEAGIAVKMVAGEPENFKITTPEDLARAEKIMAANMETCTETRMGQGFDVHAFTDWPKGQTEGNIMICGVAVPHDKAIKAHSDGDVGLHALVDALLGSIGAGDIGHHFPPSDAKWANADSSQFIKEAVRLVHGAGGRMVNVDITIIGERPKIGPHKEAMRQRVAELLGVSVGRISVKATTTEKLGFTGRKEGIAAQAVVSLEKPRESQNA